MRRVIGFKNGKRERTRHFWTKLNKKKAEYMIEVIASFLKITTQTENIIRKTDVTIDGSKDEIRCASIQNRAITSTTPPKHCHLCLVSRTMH